MTFCHRNGVGVILVLQGYQKSAYKSILYREEPNLEAAKRKKKTHQTLTGVTINRQVTSNLEVCIWHWKISYLAVPHKYHV